MRREKPHGEDPEGGFALAAVLWFMLVVTAVLTPFVVIAQTNRWVAANRESQTRLDLMADGLVTLLSLRLADPQTSAALQQSARADSNLIACSHGAYEVGIRLQEQRGLIDLNAAGEELLGAGLRSLGVGSGEVEPVAHAIMRFRSFEPEQAQPGSRVAITGGRKAAPFESVVELSDLAPLRDVEPARLRRVFTVHSRRGTVLLGRTSAALAPLLAQIEDGSVIGGEGEQSASPIAVEVTVRAGTNGIRGYSGFIVLPSGPPSFGFRRVETLIEPGFEDDDENAGINDFPCPASIQGDLALVLTEPST